MTEMTSSKPYFLRALYEWILDNELTPHFLVDAEAPGAVVPTEFVKDGRIVLNASATAVRDMAMNNDDVTFSARFSGSPMFVTLPMHSILAIYAKENGQGMFFEEDDSGPENDPDPEDAARSDSGSTGSNVTQIKKDKRPSLTLVK